MNDLNIGVIGAGSRGFIAELAHRPGEGSRVVACCDTDEAVLNRCRELYGKELFTTNSVEALLERDIDAVIIATPDFLHEEQAMAALKKRIAVYLEKPMALTTEGCDRILRCAQENRARLFVGHNMRHMPFVLEMKRIIDSGLIGEVKTAWCRHFVGHGGDFYFKDWHSERRFTTGLLLQKAAHDIDILHWLCGGYSRVVNALGALMVYDQCQNRQTVNPARRPDAPEQPIWPPLSHSDIAACVDIEDVSMMQMQLDNGVLVAYQQCHFSPDYWRNYTIIGTEGRIENFGDGAEGTHIKLWNRRSNYNAESDQIFEVGGSGENHGGSDPIIMAEFLRYVRHGGATNTSPVAARNSVAAGCAATYSLRNGGVPVEVAAVDSSLASYFTESIHENER